MPAKIFSTSTVVYFESKRLDAWVTELASQGYAFEQMPQDESWGWREARLLRSVGEYRVPVQRWREPALSRLADMIVGVDEAGRGPLAGPVVAALFRSNGCAHWRDRRGPR